MGVLQIPLQKETHKCVEQVKYDKQRRIDVFLPPFLYLKTFCGSFLAKLFQ